MSEIYLTLAVGLVFSTALSLLLLEDWRWNIVALLLQYVGVFVLIFANNPLEIVVIQLVAGWMSVAVLGMALVDTIHEIDQGTTLNLPGKLFRALIAILVALVAVSLLPQALALLPGALPQQIVGGSLLLGVGVLHISLSTFPIRIIIGLLTILAGFSVFYIAAEASTFITTFLAAINLSIALVGAYFLSISSLEVME